MHEVGLMSEALKHACRVADGAGSRHIERVTFAIADGGHVTEEIVETLFTVLSVGTVAEGADLAIEHWPARRLCLSCSRSYQSDDGACPGCGAVGMVESEVEDLVLVSIDVDG
ncbi:MAG TPA: hydrogenase/urease maturation nickel metallochaperone HypA [Thermomicrobiaceae bacterium]|nr:hydrogenase/urease maturation nickel metallochaperone HypA [Thermomicrobiaceae bacterium]